MVVNFQAKVPAPVHPIVTAAALLNEHVILPLRSPRGPQFEQAAFKFDLSAGSHFSSTCIWRPLTGDKVYFNKISLET